MIGNRFIGDVEPRTGIDHEQDDVGLVDGGERLLGHGGVDALFVTVDAAGVDHRVGLAAEHAVAVFAVTGEAGKIGHQRIAGTRQMVEQGGFAHVGAAD